VPSKTDLSALTVSELVQAYVETIEPSTTVDHIGRKNRLFGQMWDISIELKARDPALNCLRGLLDHPVREVRYDTAAQFKNIDRAVFKKILAELGESRDRVGFEARRYLEWVIRDEQAGKDTYTGPVVAPSDPSA
jgi:Domain of unknown function (DUF2019)